MTARLHVGFERGREEHVLKLKLSLGVFVRQLFLGLSTPGSQVHFPLPSPERQRLQRGKE